MTFKSNCAGCGQPIIWIKTDKEKLTKEGKDNINAQFTSIVSAPEPEDER